MTYKKRLLLLFPAALAILPVLMDQLKSGIPVVLAQNDSGLIGHWKFEEGSGSTAQDSSAAANHGTITGATYTSGRVGNGALLFVGGQSVAANGNNNTAFTTSAWFRTNAPVTNWTGILEYSTAAGFRRGIGLDPAGKPSLTYGAGYLRVSNGTRADDGVWHHIAATFDETTAALYVDGAPVTLGVAGSSAGASGSKLRIGDPAVASGIEHVDDLTASGFAGLSIDQHQHELMYTIL